MNITISQQFICINKIGHINKNINPTIKKLKIWQKTVPSNWKKKP